MASLNKVMIIGNLGADPAMRYTASCAMRPASPEPPESRTQKRL